MANQNGSLHEIKSQANSTFDQIRSEVNRLVEGMELNEIGSKVESFGRRNPYALAIAALTVGVAAGVIMKRTVESGQRPTTDVEY